MERKYTPGPWLVCDGGFNSEGIDVGPENGFSVIGGCGCCGSPWINSHVEDGVGHIEAATANARLIAAAPDLYEALELLLNEYEAVMKSDYDFLGVPITTVELARAALKLAKGE